MGQKTKTEQADPWGDDLLNVKARGETFTSLIKSIEDSKVISIEAGFGRGKTFFREAWAKLSLINPMPVRFEWRTC